MPYSVEDRRANRARCGVRAASLLALFLQTACSSQQLYGAGQGWQRNECNRIQHVEERKRCLASTTMSYEEFQRQSGSAGSR